jgi:dipeptidyl aminopeptidase/acylaminoacyl peptidase
MPLSRIHGRRAATTIAILLMIPAPAVLLPAACGAQDESREAWVPLAEALLLGPLPAPPAEPEAPLLRGSTVDVPELDPAGPWPQSGQTVHPAPGIALSWQRHEATAESLFFLDALALSEPGEIGKPAVGVEGQEERLQPGVAWLAARIQLDRFTRLKLELSWPGGATLYFDGEELASRANGSGDDPLEASQETGRGVHTVMVRLLAPSGDPGHDAGGATADADSPPDTIASNTFPGDLPLTVGVRAASDPPADLNWSLDPVTAPADFDLSRQLAGVGSLTIAPDGRYVARRLSLRHRTGEGRESSVEIFARGGKPVATGVGGASAVPLAFAPDGTELLLSLPGDSGRDLWLWTAPAGPWRRVLADEPDLGLVRFSPDGRYLLVASSRGVETEDLGVDAARHRRFLREKLPDYTPNAHLHLVELATGIRRRLTQPGDHVLDDALFLPGGGAIVYGRTVPREERPWFATQLRRIDLKSGEDRLIATFVAGWEVRPQSFAVAPDGRALVFIGPPDQIGDGRAEHNVYNKQIWLLDLASGEFERISRDGPYAFDGDRGLPGFDRNGRLLVKAYRGSDVGLARMEPSADGWSVRWLGLDDLTVQSAALSADGSAAVVTASSRETPSALFLLTGLGGRGLKPQLLEEPNRDLAAKWLLSKPRDATCTADDGAVIDAWWYRPSVRLPAESRTPVILYYYGGSSPTDRSFNFTHQWLAGNGYAVLVVNPRGAYGYGDAFADHHAGDWGPRAAADILTCLDALLQAQPGLAPDRIGIYGGSYGGFMTEYLVTVTDRFAAAVSMYGISDLATYWGQGAWGWTYGDMAVAGVAPWSDPRYYQEHSPLYRADRIRTPLLLLHGAADSNVTPGESEQLFTALSLLDKPVEMVLFPGEDHGISGTIANRVAHRTMMLEWYDRFLRDQPQAWQKRWE